MKTLSRDPVPRSQIIPYVRLTGDMDRFGSEWPSLCNPWYSAVIARYIDWQPTE